MPVYSGQSEENDHNKYSDSEKPVHVHYGADGEVCIITLDENGPEADEEYDGDPYECSLCGAEEDYDEDKYHWLESDQGGEDRSEGDDQDNQDDAGQGGGDEDGGDGEEADGDGEL